MNPRHEAQKLLFPIQDLLKVGGLTILATYAGDGTATTTRFRDMDGNEVLVSVTVIPRKP